ncbi:hypothetical protein [uncultured Nocardioides sp.]|uniref:hypothetical protein n=1 Tax=uncultured Nocardioides sp. TaxID=198441 RepID=UPI0026056967|nr:hypothetical protein [uncultured Nocardioides sp.]
MAWEEQVFSLLEDLEQQAESMYAVERGSELADRARSEYATVTLAARLAAGVGAPISLEVRGVGRLTGVLERVAAGWLRIGVAGQEWVVRTSAVVEVRGASPRAVPEVAWSVADRVGVGSALRRLADEAQPCWWHRLDGGRTEGVPVRVGADFLELRSGAQGEGVLVALDALAAVVPVGTAQVASRS